MTSTDQIPSSFQARTPGRHSPERHFATGPEEEISEEEKRSTLHRWGEKLYHLVSPSKNDSSGIIEQIPTTDLSWGQYPETPHLQNDFLRAQSDNQSRRASSQDSQKSFATLHESAAPLNVEYQTPEKAAEAGPSSVIAQPITFPALTLNSYGSNADLQVESTVDHELAQISETTHAGTDNTPSKFAEFDPLMATARRRGRQPEMPGKPAVSLMSFDTPAIPRSISQPTDPLSVVKMGPLPVIKKYDGAEHSSNSSSQQANYMDMINVYQSPTSMHRFSERDLEVIKQQTREKLEKEHQKVLSEREKELAVALEEKEEMKRLMDGYSDTMQQMMKDSQQNEDHYQSQIHRLKEDRDRLQRDSLTIENSFRDLRVRFEDIKLLNETYKMTEEKSRVQIKELQTSLQATNERYDALKAHAEEKLDGANKEIAQYKQTYEGQITLLKAKLSRTEMKLSNLETDIERKTKENVDLLRMCDELIAQLDVNKS